ncbi:hypothetical protein BDR26DRAFT_1009264 [Obelidium mucronatum]|nr:hypothetical protein BDR26DRAFT_1009264 [Obelidium mucronatum]
MESHLVDRDSQGIDMHADAIDASDDEDVDDYSGSDAGTDVEGDSEDEYDEDDDGDEEGEEGEEDEDEEGEDEEGEDDDDGPSLEDIADDSDGDIDFDTDGASVATAFDARGRAAVAEPPAEWAPPQAQAAALAVTPADSPSLTRSDTLTAADLHSLRSMPSSETLRQKSSLEILNELHLEDPAPDQSDQPLLKKKLHRSRSIRSSKSSASLRRKKAAKRPPVPLSTIMWNLGLLMLKFIVFVYKTLLLIITKVKESPFYQEKVIPALESRIYTPLRIRRDLLRLWIVLKWTQLRNLTVQDIKEWALEMREWIKQQYIILTTPKPKPPPPPPPPPGKPIAVLLAEYKASFIATIEAIKRQKWFILVSALIELIVVLSKKFARWLWKQTAPLRTSKFFKLLWRVGCSIFVLTKDLLSGISRTTGFRVVMDKVKKTGVIVFERGIKVLVSVTPLTLIGYSLQISSSKQRLETLALDLHNRIPSTKAFEIEADIVWTLRTHIGFYIFLTAVFAGITAWVYLPVLNNMKIFQALPFADKYKLIMSPATNFLQKSLTILILVLSLVTTVLFHVSLLSIDNQIAFVQHQQEWTLLNTTLTLIPTSEMNSKIEQINSAVTRDSSIYPPAQRQVLRKPVSFTKICPLNINVDSTVTTATVTCSRRQYTSATVCKCPVQEIQGCHIYKSLLEEQQEAGNRLSSASSSSKNRVSMYTVSMHCSNALSQRSQSHLETMKHRWGLRNSFQLSPFEPEWIPEPQIVVQSMTEGLVEIRRRPLHIGIQYGTVTVSFQRPVFGGFIKSGGKLGSASMALPQFKAVVVSLGSSKAPLSPLVSLLNEKEGGKGVLLDSVGTNATGGWDIFKVSLNQTLLRYASDASSNSGPIAVEIYPTTCFELQPPHRACNGSVAAVFRVPARVSYSVRATEADAVFRDGDDKNVFSVEVLFSNAVGVLSKRSGLGVLNAVSRFDVSAVFVEKKGGRNHSLAVVNLKEVEGQLQRFRVYRLDVSLPQGLGNEGGSLHVSVSKGVIGRAWPRMAVAGEASGVVEVVRGMCCRSSIGIPVLNPKSCKPGYQFTSSDSCVSLNSNNKIMPSAHPIVAPSTPAFLGGYISDQSLPSLEQGVSCPSSSPPPSRLNLQTFISPDFNASAPTPGLYTIHQTCTPHPLPKLPTKPSAAAFFISRFLHIKETPPTPHIVSLTRSNHHHNQQQHRLQLRFTFSTAIRNSSIPAKATVFVNQYRGGVLLGPCVVSMDEFDAFDGKEWVLDVSLGGAGGGAGGGGGGGGGRASSGSVITSAAAAVGSGGGAAAATSGGGGGGGGGDLERQFLDGDEFRLVIRGPSSEFGNSEGKKREGGGVVGAGGSGGGGGGGFFGWIFGGGSSGKVGSDATSGWECVDATPPHAHCLLNTESAVAVLGNVGRIVGVEFGGKWMDEGGMTLLRVRFSSAVEPRNNGGWVPSDLILRIGEKGATAGIGLVNIVSVLETAEGDVLNVIVGVSEKEWGVKKGKASVVHISVEEGRVVSVAGKGRSYVSGTAFSIGVSELLSSTKVQGGSKKTTKGSLSHAVGGGDATNQPIQSSSSLFVVVGVVVGVISVTFSVCLIVVGIVFGGSINFSKIDF